MTDADELIAVFADLSSSHADKEAAHGDWDSTINEFMEYIQSENASLAEIQRVANAYLDLDGPLTWGWYA